MGDQVRHLRLNQDHFERKTKNEALSVKFLCRLFWKTITVD